ncbi:MAG TPA: hypothetical protein VNO50_17490 [Pyrinomonadaceae bacterium]|nr:hypothetical protein [Pyrinomonadaceae bacterium]
MNASDADPKWVPCYDLCMSEQSDSNLLNFIASTVEALRVRVDTINDQMYGMATKVDLANLRDEMATKEDLARVESKIALLESEMATKADLNRLEGRMATKEGLARLETTMQGEFERVHIRIDSLDRGMGSRMGLIETDVSRLRSVLYLLVKDKPDMLRLLGQPASGESRTQG